MIPGEEPRLLRRALVGLFDIKSIAARHSHGCFWALGQSAPDQRALTFITDHDVRQIPGIPAAAGDRPDQQHASASAGDQRLGGDRIHAWVYATLRGAPGYPDRVRGTCPRSLPVLPGRNSSPRPRSLTFLLVTRAARSRQLNSTSGSGSLARRSSRSTTGAARHVGRLRARSVPHSRLLQHVARFDMITLLLEDSLPEDSFH